MERDFENVFRIEELSDDELRTLVRDTLSDYETIDADNILVTAENGTVRLAGRIGTESERRVAEHVITDVLGIKSLQNELLVDPIRRDEEPEAIDEHLARESGMHGEPLGRRIGGVDDEAGHLVEDLDAQLYGTHDVQSAIERGTSWVPPDEPTPEGLSGTDAEGPDFGEPH